MSANVRTNRHGSIFIGGAAAPSPALIALPDPDKALISALEVSLNVVLAPTTHSRAPNEQFLLDGPVLPHLLYPPSSPSPQTENAALRQELARVDGALASKDAALASIRNQLARSQAALAAATSAPAPTQSAAPAASVKVNRHGSVMITGP